MAEPTVTRKTLRRDIGRTARMTFFQRYPLGELTFTASNDTNAQANSTEIFYCNKLTQDEGFWENAYIYVLSTDSTRDGLERRLSNFNADKDGMYLEWPCNTDEIPTTDDQFELHEMWTPTRIHSAINDVIRDGWRTFPDIGVDESIVVEENKREYDLTTIDPAMVLQIYVERSRIKKEGQLTTISSTTQFGDTAMDLGELTASTSIVGDWRLSIYQGSGKGQLYTISAASTTTGLVTVTSGGSVDPDTTSKIKLWNANEKTVEWYPVEEVRFDTAEYPDKMYPQGNLLDRLEGMRLRVIYVKKPSVLSADTDATILPQYFVKMKTIAFLHDDMVGDNRADRQAHSQIAEHYDQLARDFATRNPRTLPNGTIWREPMNYGSGYMYEPDPLGWVS